MTPTEKLTEMGIRLPTTAKPVGAYVPAVRTGNLVYTSGQLPTAGGELVALGQVPKHVAIPDAQGAARQAVLNALAAIAAEAGSLDAVRRVVRLTVYVTSDPGFVEQAQVANGASELLHELFGQAGQHTRCAIGVAALPLNAPVEVDLIVEVA